MDEPQEEPATAREQLEAGDEDEDHDEDNCDDDDDDDGHADDGGDDDNDGEGDGDDDDDDDDDDDGDDDGYFEESNALLQKLQKEVAKQDTVHQKILEKLAYIERDLCTAIWAI